MARVLLAWEYGLGIGYVDRLVQIAEALAHEGHEPVFCLRDIVTTSDLLKGKPWMVMQCPLSIGVLHPTQPSFTPGSFGDLLAVNNFSNEEQLYRLVHAWHLLFMALQPAVIVGEYAPACALAAYGRIPFIATGYGYILPPPDRPDFPIFNPTVQRAPGADRILETIHRVQQRLGSELPHSAPEAIGGVAHFVTAFRETDPYAEMRSQKHVGPLEAIEPPTQPPAEPSFYAYLSASHPQIGLYAQALATAGIRGTAYIKRITPELKQFLTERGVGIYDAPPPLHPTVRAASVIVHHGGIATLHTAMAAGRPQVLLPEVNDQTVNANTIDRLGISVNGRRLANAPQIARAIRELANPAGEAVQRAQAVAADIYARAEFGSLQPLMAAIMGIVGETAPVETGAVD